MTTELIKIEKLVYGGDGLGRLASGEVIFVPWSAPGDQLKVQRLPQTSKSAKIVKGQIEEIIEPAPERVEPKCSVFGQCGGCQWQHITPAAQRDWKRQIVQESLTRLGKLPDVPVLETLGDDGHSWNFRNRVQWEVQRDPQTSTYQLGYFKAQSHDVIAFDTCWIIPDSLNKLANWIQQQLQQQPKAGKLIKRIEVMQNANEQLLLSVHGDLSSELLHPLVQAFPQIVGIVLLDPEQKFATPHVLWGEDHLAETISGRDYTVSAGSFFQTNRHATELILNILAQWMISDAETLLDLYAGVGLFSIHFHEKFKRVLAVESADSAIKDGEENCQRQGITNIQWLSGDAVKVLNATKEKLDLAIIDPPRAGCSPAVLTWLNEHITRQLLYVSCDPTTLARDLKTLVAAGWRIDAVQPIDMFPQTYHVETIVNLVR